MMLPPQKLHTIQFFLQHECRGSIMRLCRTLKRSLLSRFKPAAGLKFCLSRLFFKKLLKNEPVLFKAKQDRLFGSLFYLFILR